jgi:hypothetical protein
VSRAYICMSAPTQFFTTASYYPLKRFKRAPWTSEKGAGTVSGRVNSGWFFTLI